MRIGVIGCGKMATALVGGAVRGGAAEVGKFTGHDPSPEAAAAFTAETGAGTVPALRDLAGCDVFLLCTKPPQVAGVLAALADAGISGALLISVAAGVPLADLRQAAPPACRIIRCMPNTPALVGEGASAYAPDESATADDAATAEKLLGSVGIVLRVPEPLLDAVTGLSGSGPAFGFLMIEALADGGVRCGLPRGQALELAAQTLRGAATMVLRTGLHPGELKDRVASPGGTTIAGLAALEAGGLRSALIEAVAAAARRSAELRDPDAD